MRTPGVVSRAVWGGSGQRLAVPLIMVTIAGGGGATEPATGTVELTAHTTGRDLDPDGYTVSVDGTRETALPPNGTATVTGLAPGAHTLTLTGVAANCVLQGSAVVPVSVAVSGPARADIAVVCAFANTLAYVQFEGQNRGLAGRRGLRDRDRVRREPGACRHQRQFDTIVVARWQCARIGVGPLTKWGLPGRCRWGERAAADQRGHRLRRVREAHVVPRWAHAAIQLSRPHHGE